MFAKKLTVEAVLSETIPSWPKVLQNNFPETTIFVIFLWSFSGLFELNAECFCNYVIITKFISSTNYFSKEFFCNNLGRAGIPPVSEILFQDGPRAKPELEQEPLEPFARNRQQNHNHWTEQCVSVDLQKYRETLPSKAQTGPVLGVPKPGCFKPGCLQCLSGSVSLRCLRPFAPFCALLRICVCALLRSLIRVILLPTAFRMTPFGNSRPFASFHARFATELGPPWLCRD